MRHFFFMTLFIALNNQIAHGSDKSSDESGSSNHEERLLSQSWWSKVKNFFFPRNPLPQKESDEICPYGYHFFNETCIKLPKNSRPSSDHPGWDCLPGFIQKRSRCIPLHVPDNATLLEDGKTWVCNEGYYRYRSVCRKKKD